MTEQTKDQIAAERDALRAEVEKLRGQLTAAGAARPGTAAPAEHQFVLTEGHRQELATTGVANVDGRLLTRDQVIARLGKDQRGVDIPKVDPNSVLSVPVGRATSAIPGVDFVYPSVAPGVIDPAVAGTPGISGPAGTAKQAAAGTDRPE